MLTLISCSKTMTEEPYPQQIRTSVPAFMNEARHIALTMARYTTEELAEMLHVSPDTAAVNAQRFRRFHDSGTGGLPALQAYTGIVFKHIAPQDFTTKDWQYAAAHLRITSFLYGLLRPTDNIRSYRLEGKIRMPDETESTLFAHWRPLLTDVLIRTVREQGGILVNLASAEMKNLFHWKQVEREVDVITPDFYSYKNGKLTSVTVYTKMCRGNMTRFILKNRIGHPQELKAFEWQGYRFNESESSDRHLVFTPAS